MFPVIFFAKYIHSLQIIRKATDKNHFRTGESAAFGPPQDGTPYNLRSFLICTLKTKTVESLFSVF
jgi:hypothetical protein